MIDFDECFDDDNAFTWTWAYPGGSALPPKKFEPCSRCGSNFFGGGPDPDGYNDDLLQSNVQQSQLLIHEFQNL